MDANIKASEFFNDNIRSQHEVSSIPDDVLDKGLELIDVSRTAVNTEIGVLSALHFDDSGLNQFVDGFKNDLNALDELFKAEEADADLQLHRAHISSYKWKLYLLLPMSMIVGAFAVIVIRKFKSVVT